MEGTKLSVDRIRRMERLYDTLRYAVATGMPLDTGVVKDARAELAAYLDGGGWLADFELDEAGLLPSQLKRGVLSEDGLYNLLCLTDEITNGG